MRALTERIEKQLGIPDLSRKLADELSLSDLNSLLLEVYRRKTLGLTAPQLLKNYTANRFVHPSNLPVTEFLKTELQLLQSAMEQGFEPLELSPLAPLGSCSVVATVNQDKIISALRGTEIVADATNVLALEAGMRRASIRNRQQEIKLCTIHRHVRTQPLTKPGMLPHFKIFCMLSAGRDSGNFEFEIRSINEHLKFYLRHLQSSVPGIKLKLKLKALNSESPNRLYLVLYSRLKENFSNLEILEITADQRKEQYYRGIQFKLFVQLHGEEYDIADGGFVDWSQQLAGDSKERMLISGLGTEFLFNLFSNSTGE